MDYYNNYHSFEDTDLSDDFDDFDEVYELETDDLPEGCPYRQLFPTGPFPSPFGGFGGPGGAPSGPPPTFIPQKTQTQLQGGIGIQAVDPGAIRPCTYRFVYIWLRNGRSFWAWLTFVGRRSAAGFRWNGRRWVYFGIDLNRIDAFVCY